MGRKLPPLHGSDGVEVGTLTVITRMPWVMAASLLLASPRPVSSNPVHLSPVFPLHVAGQAVVGPRGQVPWFRGVNANGLVQYNPRFPEQVALNAADFREMRALGFNLVRLPLSLSRLEPYPGKFSVAYLHSISQVVSWARSQGIWVILDLHQDRYAANLFPGEADGFPPWMVMTFGLKTTPVLAGITDPAVQGAFSSFWLNRAVAGHGLQYYYFLALKKLASTFARNPAVAGYDVMNEPNPGFFPPLEFASTVLLPFYRQAVTAIRSVSRSQPIFLEPDVVSMLAGYQAWPYRRWFDRGIVFEPHMYTGTYRGLDLSHFLRTLGAHLVNPMIRANLTPWNGTSSSLAIPYDQAQSLARKEKVPFLVGEFGDSPTATGNAWLEDEIRLQNQFGVGGLLWLWQIRQGSYPWGLVSSRGGLTRDPERATIMASPHPLVVGGRVLSSTFHFKSNRYQLTYQAVYGSGATKIYLSHLTYAHGFQVAASPGQMTLSRTITKYGGPGAHLSATILTIAPQSGRVGITIRPHAPRVGGPSQGKTGSAGHNS